MSSMRTSVYDCRCPWVFWWCLRRRSLKIFTLSPRPWASTVALTSAPETSGAPSLTASPAPRSSTWSKETFEPTSAASASTRSVAPVRKVAEYLVAAGGKRLRPALLLLACGALGYRGEARLTAAAVIEFIHTATLLHDDVVDESRLRRGAPTANAAFGNAASVLVGDFLYSRSFQMMVQLDDMRVMRALADATNIIAAGEVLQLMGSHDPQVDEARYLEVIRRKTAKLFEAAARLGAVLARSAPELEDGLARYGAHVGTAFQLIDDVLDYSGDEAAIGKHLGDDLAEGKPTLPLIHALRSGDATEQAVVRQAIVAGGRADFGAVLGAIRRCG